MYMGVQSEVNAGRLPLSLVTETEAHSLSKPSCHRAPRSLLSPLGRSRITYRLSPAHLGFYMGLGIRTQALMLIWQALPHQTSP